jgi:hypothetical protein
MASVAGSRWGWSPQPSSFGTATETRRLAYPWLPLSEKERGARRAGRQPSVSPLDLIPRRGFDETL